MQLEHNKYIVLEIMNMNVLRIRCYTNLIGKIKHLWNMKLQLLKRRCPLRLSVLQVKRCSRWAPMQDYVMQMSNLF